MGVRRAAELAWAQVTASSGARVYTMGPLIHNPQVLADFERRGCRILGGHELSPDTEGAAAGPLEGATVIIRAHGITPALEAELVRRGAVLVDATCPHVKASQMKAKALSEDGYTVFLAGEKQHGEITGIMGYAPACIVVANREEAEAAAMRARAPGAQAALIAQTTLSPEEYRSIGEGIAKYIPHIKIINTICGATKERQDSLRELCAQVEAVVVAGGRTSANTRRLEAIAEACGKPAWLVEGPADLPPELAAYSVVGLHAGASTPEEVIDAVGAALLAL
jgi:4-hydroxy-3-methylbut-2-enyl diphosphate reductase